MKDRTDLVAVATALLGPPARRSGSRWAWLCPFHPDRNPSFTVDARGWRCWACGIGGNAASLVIRHRNIGFPEALSWLAEQAGIAVPPPSPSRVDRAGPAGPASRTGGPAGPTAPPDGSWPNRTAGMDPADALTLVDDAAERLWASARSKALSYLRGRGLTETTIKAARLGWTARADGVPWKPPGWVIPWLDGDRLTLAKIRVPDGWPERFPKDRRPPKYIEAFRDRPLIYPSTAAIWPGEPLVVVEGEFDARLLARELAGLASVVTTGSASSRPDGALYLAVLRSPAWYTAHDADAAGERAAAEWPARAVRVRPPAGKDWTDCLMAGIDLRRWWVEAHFPAESDSQERAAIMEHDGGLTREAAERAAGLSIAKSDGMGLRRVEAWTIVQAWETRN